MREILLSIELVVMGGAVGNVMDGCYLSGRVSRLWALLIRDGKLRFEHGKSLSHDALSSDKDYVSKAP